MSSLAALILDFDGTLLATEELWYEVCRDQYRSRGQELSWSDYQRCVGGSLAHFDPYADLARRLGNPGLRRELVTEAVATHARQAAGLGLKPGVAALLDQARDLGLRLAIASGSPARDILPHLERLGIADRFEVVCTADDVAEVKPHPALYLAALGALGLEPGQALAVEDSPHGVRAACDAGLACVAVPTPLTRDSGFDPRARRLESLADLDLRDFA